MTNSSRKRSLKRKNATPLFIFLIFGLAGVAMLIGGFLLMRSSIRFQNIAVEVTGTISDIESRRGSDGDVSHSTFVSYSYNGRDYDNIPLGYYNSGMHVGKDILLLVDPGAPTHIASKSGDTFAYVMLLAIGLLFLLLGFIPTTGMLKNSIKGKKLMQTGQLLQATVDRIDQNYSVSYNRRHPYLIYCTYYDAYKDVTYRFKSRNVMVEPGYAPGDPIEVYVDPDDYSKYVVNTDPPANPKVIDYT